MYKIGGIRRLDFGSRWGIALVPGEGITYVPLRDLFRAWARFLYLVVEMENALRNDFGYLRGVLTAGDEPLELSPLKVQYAANTHARFLEAYFDCSLGPDVRRLSCLTIGLCAPDVRVDRLDRELAAAPATREAKVMRAFSDRARSLYLEVSGRDPARNPEALERARRCCALVEAHDRRFLAELKLAVGEGVRVFEELEATAAEQGGNRLVASLMGIPGVARRYCSRFAGGVAESGAGP
jgi:hypothetical protein